MMDDESLSSPPRARVCLNGLAAMMPRSIPALCRALVQDMTRETLYALGQGPCSQHELAARLQITEAMLAPQVEHLLRHSFIRASSTPDGPWLFLEPCVQVVFGPDERELTIRLPSGEQLSVRERTAC